MAPLLAVRDLHIAFPSPAGPPEAVTGVSFTVGAGETVAVVGESGSGKSVTSLAVMGLLGAGRVTHGSITFRDEELVGAEEERLRRHCGSTGRCPAPPAIVRWRCWTDPHRRLRCYPHALSGGQHLERAAAKWWRRMAPTLAGAREHGGEAHGDLPGRQGRAGHRRGSEHRQRYRAGTVAVRRGGGV